MTRMSHWYPVTPEYQRSPAPFFSRGGVLTAGFRCLSVEKQRGLSLGGFLRFQAHGDRPSAVRRRRATQWRSPRRAGDVRDFILQLENLSGDFCNRDFGGLFAVEELERKRGMKCAVHRATPACPKRALG